MAAAGSSGVPALSPRIVPPPTTVPSKPNFDNSDDEDDKNQESDESDDDDDHDKDKGKAGSGTAHSIVLYYGKWLV